MKKLFTVEISGELDRYDINDIKWKIQEWMQDEYIKLEVVSEECIDD